MRDVIRIKRRPAGGEPGPPGSLAASEVAYNEVDDTLYYGKGDSDGRATEIVAIGGAAVLTDIESLWIEIRRLNDQIEVLKRNQK